MPTISSVPPNRKAFKLRSPTAANGSFRVVRHISSLEGERMVEQKKALHVPHPETGETIGYRLVSCHASSPVVRARLADDLGRRAAFFVIRDSKPSSTTPTMGEAAAAIGVYGPSRTEGMTREQRLAREAAGEEMHDFVEVARVKLQAFAPLYRA
jgi:hypothetical protein